MNIELEDVVFEPVGLIDPERTPGGGYFENNPLEEVRLPQGAEFHDYGKNVFCRFHLGKQWNVAGVFVLTQDKGVMYAGKCQDLNQQFGKSRYGKITLSNCFKKNGRVTACKINSLVLQASKNGKPISLWIHKEKNQKAQLAIRSRIRDALSPPWNG